MKPTATSVRQRPRGSPWEDGPPAGGQALRQGRPRAADQGELRNGDVGFSHGVGPLGSTLGFAARLIRARAHTEVIPQTACPDWTRLAKRQTPADSGADEPQADGKRIAEGLALARPPRARCTRGRGGWSSRRPRAARAGRDHAVADVLVEVAGAVARDPRELRQGEDGVGRSRGPGRTSRLEERVDPALGGLLADGRVGRAVERDPRPEPAQAPEDVVRQARPRQLLRSGPRRATPSARPRAVRGWRRSATSRPARAARAWAGPPSWRRRPPWRAGGRGRAGGRSRRGAAAIRPGGDPPPEDPPLGPALHVLDVLAPPGGRPARGP